MGKAVYGSTLSRAERLRREGRPLQRCVRRPSSEIPVEDWPHRADRPLCSVIVIGVPPAPTLCHRPREER